MKNLLAVVLLLALFVPLRTLAQPLPSLTLKRDGRIAQAAEGLREELVRQRRDFHMHPELSNREERTSRASWIGSASMSARTATTGPGRLPFSKPTTP